MNEGYLLIGLCDENMRELDESSGYRRAKVPMSDVKIQFGDFGSVRFSLKDAGNFSFYNKNKNITIGGIIYFGDNEMFGSEVREKHCVCYSTETVSFNADVTFHDRESSMKFIHY
jgi:hypothetical protein